MSLGNVFLYFSPRQNPQCYQKQSIFFSSQQHNEKWAQNLSWYLLHVEFWWIRILELPSNFRKYISFKLVPSLIPQLLPIREVVCLLFPLQGVCVWGWQKQIFLSPWCLSLFFKAVSLRHSKKVVCKAVEQRSTSYTTIKTHKPFFSWSVVFHGIY